MDNMDSFSLIKSKEMNIMREGWDETATSTGTRRAPEGIQNQTYEHTEHSLTLPPPLTVEEYDDIRRCFNRANIKVEDYLDCEELKTYMDLRKCPISLWEAKKILKYADPTYHYYISLEQILELATLYGVGTSNPLKMNRYEFEKAVQNAFRLSRYDFNEEPRGSTGEADFYGIVNFFESRTLQERGDNDQRWENSWSQITSTEGSTAEIDASTNFIETDENEVAEELQEPVQLLKEKWEHRIQGEQISSGKVSSLVQTENLIHYKQNKTLNTETKPIEMETDSLKVESIYKRQVEFNQQLFMNEMLSKVKEIGQKFKPTMIDIGVGVEFQHIISESGNNSEEIKQKKPIPKIVPNSYYKGEQMSLKPPLPPPPMVPDIPEEWKSRKIGDGESKIPSSKYPQPTKKRIILSKMTRSPFNSKNTSR